MKKICILAFVLVLTVAAFTGCGCRNTQPLNTTAPTVSTTMPTTLPTTEMTTAPTTAPTAEATIEDGNGPLPTEDTVSPDARGRSQSSTGNNSGSKSAGRTATSPVR